MEAPVAPRIVLPRQAQYQQADGPDGSGPADPLGSGASGVACGDQVAVPAQHRVRTYHKADPV